MGIFHFVRFWCVCVCAVHRHKALVTTPPPPFLYHIRTSFDVSGDQLTFRSERQVLCQTACEHLRDKISESREEKNWPQSEYVCVLMCVYQWRNGGDLSLLRMVVSSATTTVFFSDTMEIVSVSHIRDIVATITLCARTFCHKLTMSEKRKGKRYS